MYKHSDPLSLTLSPIKSMGERGSQRQSSFYTVERSLRSEGEYLKKNPLSPTKWGRGLGRGGFTLIEIMLVIFIIGISSGLAMLSTGLFDRDRQLKNMAKQITRIVRLAGNEALLNQMDLGIAFYQRGFIFLRFGSNNTWAPLTNNNLLQNYTLPARTQLTITIEGQNIALSSTIPKIPQIVISSAGELTPFTVGVAISQKPPSYWITGQPQGNVEWNTAK